MTALHVLNRFVLIPFFSVAIGHEVEDDKPQWHRLWTGKHAGNWHLRKGHHFTQVITEHDRKAP